MLIEAPQDFIDLAGEQQQTAEPWAPNARFETMYEYLSNLSTLDGNESPRHKEVKEYAKARSKAKARLEPTSKPSSCNAVALATCSKEEAETAASIRQQLRESLGDEGAAQILAGYQSKILRDRCGKPQRFLVDSAGTLVGLVRHKNVAHE